MCEMIVAESVEQLIQFQREMARYFQRIAATTKEDREYWASLYNEENCLRSADALQAYAAHSQSPSLPTPAATPTDSANPPPVESVGPNSEAQS